MLDEIANIMHIIAVRSEAANPQNEGDYVKDGLLFCGKCHTQKQCRPFPDNPECLVYCACKCKIDEQDEYERRQKAVEIESARRRCFIGDDGHVTDDIENTFAADKYNDTQLQYVKKFAENVSAELQKELDARNAMLADKPQFVEYERPDYPMLLLFGTNGTGKSFLAACACNALIDAGFTAHFTSISRIEKDLFGTENKSKVFAEIMRCDMIVIDDFGAERQTEYMGEIAFNVIDCIIRENKPCIITSNLTNEEFANPLNAQNKRVYSRIMKKAIPIVFKGEDRRKAAMKENRESKKRWIT